MKVDLLGLLKEFYDGSIRMERINFSQIVLIPKNSTSSKVDDYRSLALLNSSLKIISKVLADRLAPKISEIRLWETISPDSSRGGVS